MDGWSAGSQALPSISGRTFERIIKIVAIPCGRIDKSVAVFLFIHWLQKEAFVTRLCRVFDQDSCRAIDSPHFEPCAEDSTIGVKLVQTRHGMEAIDGDSILSVKTVIGTIFNGTAIEHVRHVREWLPRSMSQSGRDCECACLSKTVTKKREALK